MSAKDTVIGTTKRLVAEIVGDGALAEEGSRQCTGEAPRPAHFDGNTTVVQNPEAVTAATKAAPDASALTDHERFALLLGHAALKAWPDLPREAQEWLFTAAVDDGIIANSLAVYLHDRHPKTLHPSKPAQVA